MSAWRAYVRAGVALAACGVVLAAGPALAQQAPSPAPSPMPAVTAQSFVDSVGVNTHFSYVDTAYAHRDQLVAALQDLGVHHVRDSLVPRPPAEFLSTLRDLPSHDIHVDLIFGVRDQQAGQVLPPFPTAWSSFQAAGLSSAVDGIEAPNEFDMRGGSDWVSALRAYQQQLYATVRRDPQLAGVPVVGPSVGRHTLVGELAGFGLADVANLHNYPRGGTPEDGLVGELAAGKATEPGDPLWVTETGYHTALHNTKNQPPVPVAAKADYTPRTLLEDFVGGAARTYLYQLVDEKPDPGLTDQEEHFGLLSSDLTPTPAYDTVKALLSAVADPGPSFTPAPLAVSVRADPTVRHLLLAKRDGSYSLVLWRRGRTQSGTTVVAGAAPVTVTVGGAARPARLVATDGGAQDLGTPSTVDGVIGNGVVVLQLARPSGGPGATARFDARALASVPPSAGPAPSRPSGSTHGSAVGVVVAVALGGLAVLAAAAALALRERRRRRAEQAPHEHPPGPSAPL